MSSLGTWQTLCLEALATRYAILHRQGLSAGVSAQVGNAAMQVDWKGRRLGLGSSGILSPLCRMSKQNRRYQLQVMLHTVLWPMKAHP